MEIFSNRKRLFARGPLAKRNLFAGGPPANKILFAGGPPTNKFLYAGKIDLNFLEPNHVTQKF